MRHRTVRLPVHTLKGPRVKFKMSSNSLFAILLRSPWWISFVIAAAIGIVGAALLPEKYALMGVVGSLPILGVGCVAAWRQLRAPSAAQVDATVDAALALPWRTFADTLHNAWEAGGAVVERLPGPSADFRLTQDGRVTLVKAQRWKAASHGADSIRQLLASMPAAGATAASYMAIQGDVSAAARALARDNDVVLMDRAALAKLLRGVRR